jgi:hypothetical protein
MTSYKKDLYTSIAGIIISALVAAYVCINNNSNIAYASILSFGTTVLFISLYISNENKPISPIRQY